MSSAVARPIRNSSKKLTSSTCYVLLLRVSPVTSHFLDRRRLTPAQVDAELFGGPEDLVVGLPHLQGDTVAGEHLDVEAQRLELLEQHLEGLGNARFRNVFALDD